MVYLRGFVSDIDGKRFVYGEKKRKHLRSSKGWD